MARNSLRSFLTISPNSKPPKPGSTVDGMPTVMRTWVLTLLISALSVLAALGMWIAADYDMHGSNRANRFSASYTLFFIVTLGIGGTLVLNKLRAPMSVGFFLGCCLMMAYNMLSMTVMSAGAIFLAKTKDKQDSTADQISTIFSSCLFVLYR